MTKPVAARKQTIRGAHFEELHLEAKPPIRNRHLVDCSFTRCLGGGGFGKLAQVTGITLERTKAGPFCGLRSAILRDVIVDTVDTAEVATFEYCLFDRVTLRGDVGGFQVTCHQPGGLPAKQLEVMSTFYDDVEWALDIREARFTQAIFRGVPGDKIRFDPERQAILRKDRLRLDPSWRALPASVLSWVAFWLREEGDDELLVACDHSPHFEAQLARLRILRDAGFAT